jgi:predicted dehydrogenase
VEDNVFALLRASEQKVASIHVSWTQWKNISSFEVQGKDGYISADGLGVSYGVHAVTLGSGILFGPFRWRTVEYRSVVDFFREEL